MRIIGSKAKLNKDLESLILNYFALTSGHAFGKDSCRVFKLHSNYITKERSFSTARCNPIRDKCRGKALAPLSTDRIIAVPPVSRQSEELQ